jgi:hypothetical protein
MKRMNTEMYAGYATEIANGLAAIQPQELQNSRPVWTHKIKEVVGGIGKKHDFSVCASGFVGGDWGEWLYDLVWYRNNKDKRLASVPLVLESEWHLDGFEIRVDFEKLLLANSPLKVMVFQSREEDVEATFEKLTCGINEYSFEGTCIYVLACYSVDGRRIKIKKFKKGPHTPPELMSMADTHPVNAAHMPATLRGE